MSTIRTSRSRPLESYVQLSRTSTSRTSTRVVRPRAELHTAQLVVEREPADVDFARTQEHTGRHPQTADVDLTRTQEHTGRYP